MLSLKKINKLVSHSPIVDITYQFENKLHHTYALCGWYSLTGSIKDRVAYQIFYDAITAIRFTDEGWVSSEFIINTNTGDIIITTD